MLGKGWGKRAEAGGGAGGAAVAGGSEWPGAGGAREASRGGRGSGSNTDWKP